MRAVVSTLLVLAIVIAARPAGAQDLVPPPAQALAPVDLLQPLGQPPQGPPPQGQPPQGPPPAPAKAPRFVPPQPTPQPGQPGPQPGPPAVPMALPGPVVPKRMVNIQIEATITDQLGTAAPDKKTVSMIASDSTWGRIRATASARPNDRMQFVPTVLNVDARPFLLPNADAIQLELTIEYKPLRSVTATGEQALSEGTNLNQSMSVILQNGKPLLISQAADPVADRKILVEVKATILK